MNRAWVPKNKEGYVDKAQGGKAGFINYQYGYILTRWESGIIYSTDIYWEGGKVVLLSVRVYTDKVGKLYHLQYGYILTRWEVVSFTVRVYTDKVGKLYYYRYGYILTRWESCIIYSTGIYWLLGLQYGYILIVGITVWAYTDRWVFFF